MKRITKNPPLSLLPPPVIPAERTKFASLSAFTLIELLVVIAIVGVLAVITSVVLRSSLERSKAGRTISDLRQIGAAMMLYAGENDGLFPISGSTIPYDTVDPRTQRPSWQEQLQDYVEGNRKFFEGPATKEQRRGAYFNGTSAAFEEAKAAGEEVVFGAVRFSRIVYPSKYVLAGEIRSFGMFQPEDADPDNYASDPALGFGTVTKPAHLLFADGHVGSFMSYDPNAIIRTYDVVPE